MDTLDFIFLLSGTTLTGGLAGIALFHSITGTRSARELTGEWMLALATGLITSGGAIGQLWVSFVGSLVMLGALIVPLRRVGS